MQLAKIANFKEKCEIEKLNIQSTAVDLLGLISPEHTFGREPIFYLEPIMSLIITCPKIESVDATFYPYKRFSIHTRLRNVFFVCDNDPDSFYRAYYRNEVIGFWQLKFPIFDAEDWMVNPEYSIFVSVDPLKRLKSLNGNNFLGCLRIKIDDSHIISTLDIPEEIRPNTGLSAWSGIS